MHREQNVCPEIAFLLRCFCSHQASIFPRNQVLLGSLVARNMPFFQPELLSSEDGILVSACFLFVSVPAHSSVVSLFFSPPA